MDLSFGDLNTIVRRVRAIVLFIKHKFGAPGAIRTHDPCLRRAVLYPAELRARGLGGTKTHNAITRAVMVA